MIVFGRREDVRVERIDLRGPRLGVRLGVLARDAGAGSSSRGRLKSVMSTSSNAASRRRWRCLDPARDGFGLAARPGASDDDGDVDHELGSFAREPNDVVSSPI